MNYQIMLSNSKQIADAEYAARVARMLMGTYPQQEAKDAETYLGLVVARLVGEWCSNLQAMMNPRTGLISEAKFLPTIAEINEYLKNLQERYYHSGIDPNWRQKAIEKEKKIAAEETATPEEREACVKRAMAAREEIRKAARGSVFPHEDEAPIPRQTPEEERASLARLMQTDLMRGISKS